MEKPGFGSAQEFFDLWLKTYEDTFCRLTKVPAMGPARERSEKFMKGISNFVSLYAKSIDNTLDFQTLTIEAMRRLHEKVITEEITPEKHKDFYNLWIETYSETFKEFLKSDHFASDMGAFMSYFMEWLKYNRQVLEEDYLKPMNLPTRSDIDEINRELYSLKKKVKELNLQIKEMEKK